MDCNNPCSNPQCPVHRIKHFLCNKPDCAICSTAHGPILCDETHAGDGQVYLLTQRERNIASIVKFFHDNCLQYLMSLNNVDQYAQDLTQFSLRTPHCYATLHQEMFSRVDPLHSYALTYIPNNRTRL